MGEEVVGLCVGDTVVGLSVVGEILGELVGLSVVGVLVEGALLGVEEGAVDGLRLGEAVG